MNSVRERVRDAATAAPRLEEDPYGRLVQRRGRRRRHDRLLAGGVALVVAVAAVGGALFALGRAAGGGSGTPGDGGTAPSSLALQPGQHFYLKATIFLGEDGGQVTEETWWAAEGSGRIRSDTNTEKYGPLPPGTYEAGEFPVESDVSGLSTDPRVLLDQLRERSAPGGASPQPDVTPGGGLPLETGQLWRAVRRLLEYPNATPQLRWALFEVAAGLEGVERTDREDDPVGRPAVALRLTAGMTEWTLYFDPVYHQLMAWYTYYERGAAATILDSGVVASTDEVPAGDQWLFPEATNLEHVERSLEGEWPPDPARSP